DPNGTANAFSTTYDYTDPLDRLMSVHSADGGSTTYTYHTVEDRYLTKSVDITAPGGATQHAVTQSRFDGMGRASESRVYEDGAGASACFITAATTYDNLGRVSTV